MTKNYVTLYYYFFLVYNILKTAPEQNIFTQLRHKRLSYHAGHYKGKSFKQGMGRYRSRLRHMMWREQLTKL